MKLKKTFEVFALILLVSGIAISASWLVIDYGKEIKPGELIEARDINEMACELVFMCGHDCGYTINQKFGCSGDTCCGWKTINADNWAWSGSCDRLGCQCNGGDCETSGPVHAGDPVKAEDLNRIIASIKIRANGWCTINDPEISGIGFVNPGEPILASKVNKVRDALDHLSKQQNQCPSPHCCTIGFFATEGACNSAADYEDPNNPLNCLMGSCTKCYDDVRWGLIACDDDLAGFGPCSARVCIWPGCMDMVT